MIKYSKIMRAKYFSRSGINKPTTIMVTEVEKLSQELTALNSRKPNRLITEMLLAVAAMAHAVKMKTVAKKGNQG